MDVIKAVVLVENARLNAICDRIIAINPASSNTLNAVKMTPAQLKAAVIQQLP